MTEIKRILQEHMAAYEQSRPQDFVKLLYQNEFGPRHVLNDPDMIQPNLRRELLLAGKDRKKPEYIGNGLSRFYLDGCGENDIPLVERLLKLTAQEQCGNWDLFADKLRELHDLPIESVTTYLEEYAQRGYPVVSHSDEYRTAYQPHYRVLRKEYADWYPVLLSLQKQADKGGGIIAIDGRCGSGKSTLAEIARRVFGCHIFHMDDYYLPLEKRERGWESKPCSNMDLHRFEKEILKPLSHAESVFYRPYNCGQKAYAEGVIVPYFPMNIVEGSYSLSPDFRKYYRTSYVISCSKETQRNRLQQREGTYYAMFQERWIPLEEQYFKDSSPERFCEIVVQTDTF